MNVHLHTLALDGVYVRDEEGELHFHPLPPPSWEEVEQVAAWTYEKIRRALVYHGRSLEGLDDLPDALASEHPVLASCYGASAGDVQLLGDSPGERVDRLAWPVHLSPVLSDALAEVGGVNVHAKVSVDGRDRERVESALLRGRRGARKRAAGESVPLLETSLGVPTSEGLFRGRGDLYSMRRREG